MGPEFHLLLPHKCSQEEEEVFAWKMMKLHRERQEIAQWNRMFSKGSGAEEKEPSWTSHRSRMVFLRGLAKPLKSCEQLTVSVDEAPSSGKALSHDGTCRTCSANHTYHMNLFEPSWAGRRGRSKQTEIRRNETDYKTDRGRSPMFEKKEQ